ncbi:type I-D CRISPR-associated protein Cas10d/Csc3 [Calothrix rhizosoleniae]|uniref:type I-D CRISPR-associated protein Cas10d/Csc3 n=1 Tax=Calothrix rhizosoleniae TaxID=888997 RepID=UPI000B49EEF6|nr:type I-D CRISPR-associated protein Cas10d/Csc3 [Calothrix rhizosoleniae]
MSQSLLQTLLIETLPEDTDPILRAYVETILPALEREFSLTTALGGSEEAHYQILSQLGDKYAREKAQKWSQKPDQSLMVHVLNALLTSWNLLPYLNSANSLTEVEKYLLCLGITLHDYDKHCRSQGIQPPGSDDIPAILKVCEELGEKLNFDLFWSEWRKYIVDIAFLAQNTQLKHGTNIIPANWLRGEGEFAIQDYRRLKLPLRYLLAFGDVAVHLTDPGDIDTKTGGDRLREHLRSLGINKKLVYHRLRDTIGILSNGIHNAVMLFARELAWEPILFFAQGIIYLAPHDYQTPNSLELQDFIWQQISGVLSSKMLTGDIGFKRDGKGLKVAPQTLELFTPLQIIPELPLVIETKVTNIKNPATPKRLEKLGLSESEKDYLSKVADIRCDRIAEFIFLIQKEFFGNSPEYISWMLNTLDIFAQISPEKTQFQAGGVNYGWYQAAAHYVAANPTLTLEEVTAKMSQWAQELAVWAQENNLLPEYHSPTKEVFASYLHQYLEVKGWGSENLSFNDEFVSYTVAKTTAAKQPICSLSSGEFISEDQMDSVVLFKPQQYSNKNPLGGRQIKRGISKIWSLEMLLRQAFWGVPSGKLEEQQPIFLYIFPAYIYSPQTAAAIKLLVNNMKRANMWDVRKQWVNSGMDNHALQSLDWLNDEAISGRFQTEKYVKEELPFMAMTYTKTTGKTLTDAWIQPAFLALTLPMLLGVKVVATSSNVPLYNNDQDFYESVILDAPPGFWTLLGLSTSLRIQDFETAIQRLLIAYSLHLDTRSSPPDGKWRDFIKTVREVTTNILNVFALANQKLRADNRDVSNKEVYRYWEYAQILSMNHLEDKYTNSDGGRYLMSLITKLVQQYRTFYQANLSESSHTILLPISKALEIILSVPQEIDDEDLILEGAGQLKDALERQEPYKRPLIMDKSVDYSIRQAEEIKAIHTFMTTCVKELFHQQYQGDRALLQENRNRIKSGVEFAYRWLALQENSQESQSNSSSADK